MEFDPLQLSTVAAYVNQASGVSAQGYSVTLPYLLGENGQYNQGSVPDLAALGLLNVRYVITNYALDLAGADLVFQSGDTRVYENAKANPRAWIQPAGADVGTQIRSVNHLEIAADKVIVQAQGPGRFVLSEIFYPGWTATIDGKPAEILRVANLFRGIDLDAGNHLIVMTYRPVQLYAGMGLSGLSWLLVIAGLLLGRKIH